jgi:hypothetical protein
MLSLPPTGLGPLCTLPEESGSRGGFDYNRIGGRLLHKHRKEHVRRKLRKRDVYEDLEKDTMQEKKVGVGIRHLDLRSSNTAGATGQILWPATEGIRPSTDRNAAEESGSKAQTLTVKLRA